MDLSKLSAAARLAMDEVGIDERDFERDVERYSLGRISRNQLLSFVLDGSNEDRVEGWTDYVDAVVEAAGGVS